MFAFVDPFDQLYVYGAVPPLPPAVADPFVPPLQLTFVLALIVAVTAVGSIIVTEAVAEHEFKSLTVTV